MINMIEPGRDRSARTQLRLQKLARKLSPPRRDGSIRQGASVRGWVKVLHREVDQPYRLVGTDTLNQAVKLAARAIERTGAPVGLLVWRGRHAWVMSGFEATKDLSDGGKVTSVTIYDPLYPFGDDFWGPSPRPGVPISVRALGRQFVPRRTITTTTTTVPDVASAGLPDALRQVRPRAAVRAARTGPPPRLTPGPDPLRLRAMPTDLSTPYRTPYLRPAPRRRRRHQRAPVRLGPPPPRPRPAHLPRPARPARDHPGCRGRHGIARSPRSRLADPLGVRGERLRRGRTAAARNGEPEAPHGRDRAPGERHRDPVRGEDPAVLHQRTRRPGRRERAPRVPLPRHPARADAAAAPAAQPDGPGDPRGPPRAWVRRGRDADADQEHARRAPATSSSRRVSSRAASTRFRRARSSSSSCSWSPGSTATSRSPAATATRTCAATASRSSPSSTSR